MPSLMAASKPSGEAALISVTLATVMALLHLLVLRLTRTSW
jgi:hypothetical protein